MFVAAAHFHFSLLRPFLRSPGLGNGVKKGDAGLQRVGIRLDNRAANGKLPAARQSPQAPLPRTRAIVASRRLDPAGARSDAAQPNQIEPFSGGECHFEEDRAGPPSRAYLKLWEALTRVGAWPGPGDACLDLGAAPGGWTWALAQLGAAVTAVDKAPLDPAVVALPGVATLQDSAFALHPRPVDWLVCDVIAYPHRLFSLVERWISSGMARRIVCTVKFQGATDFEAQDAFAAIPGATLAHLYHNKHELTFAWASCSRP